MYFFSVAFWDMTLASVCDLCTLATKPLSWDVRVARDLVKQLGWWNLHPCRFSRLGRKKPQPTSSNFGYSLVSRGKLDS